MTFLRNCWYVAAYPDEIGRTPMARTFLDEPVVLYRKEDGEVVALDNRCAHRLAPLNQGRLVGDVIQCAYHGLQFDSTGTCVKLPSGGLVPPRAKLKVYPVAERHAVVWIWMGVPALADPAAIPDFSSIENPEYGWFNGYLYAKANYQLMVDNLLDLSHSEFLHPQLSSPGWSARNEQTVTQVGDTITVDNVAHNDNILPLMAQIMPQMSKVGTTKQMQRWDPPALLQLSVDYYAGDDSFMIPSGHFLTPETQASTHYFVRGGQSINPGSAEFTEGMKQGVLHIFGSEDVPMVEAQQRFIGDGDLMLHDPAILTSDLASTRARRWLAKKIRDEQARATLQAVI